MPAWIIVEHPGLEGLRQLEADWRRLLAAMPERGPQHAYEVHLAYLTHLSAAEGRFTCLALTDGERVRAICPLEAGTATILGRRTPAWGLPWRQHDFFRDVVCPRDEAQRELLPAVRRYLRRDPRQPPWLVFDRVLEGSALCHCLSSLPPGAYCLAEAGRADVLDTTGSFDRYGAGLAKKFRAKLRSCHRRLEELADVGWVSAVEATDVAREFDAFLAVEASGWKGESGERGAIQLKPEQLAFYRTLGATLTGDAHCEIHALYAEGHCIAAQFCVGAGTEYVTLKGGYDERYARLAPGVLLRERVLQRCFQDADVRRVNMVTDAAWHRDWRPASEPICCAYVALDRWWVPLVVPGLRLRNALVHRLNRWLGRRGEGQR